MSDDLAAAIRDAQRPRSCPACGRTFATPSAYTIAHDGPTGRCLPDHFFEAQLVQVDGVYVRRGSNL